jgi:mycothiol synthase
MITTALPLLTTRPDRGQADLPALVALYQACEQADPADHAPTLAELQHRLDHPPPGGRLYRQFLETPAGELAGVLALWMADPRTDIPPDPATESSADRAAPSQADTSSNGASPSQAESQTYPPVIQASMNLRLHPHYRHQGLESLLLDWVGTQVPTLRADAAVPIHLRATVKQTAAEMQDSYEAHGFQRVRCFQELQRPLGMAVAEPSWPPGVAMQQANLYPAEDWVALFNDTFVDHWHFVPYTLADYEYRLQQPTYQPNLDWVAVAEGGILIGFCTAHIPHEDNARKHCQEGWIAALGTRRGYRRQGLARAMLLYGLQQLQKAGLDTALIGVDRDNPNHAKTLYESVGFCVKDGWLNYTKVLT